MRNYFEMQKRQLSFILIFMSFCGNQKSEEKERSSFCDPFKNFWWKELTYLKRRNSHHYEMIL